MGFSGPKSISLDRSTAIILHDMYDINTKEPYKKET